MRTALLFLALCLGLGVRPPFALAETRRPCQVAQPAYLQSVQLPDGRTLCPAEPAAALPDIRLSLETLSVNKELQPELQVAETVGNHATVLSQEPVETPEGQATLALALRTPPAAARSGTGTTEYWLVLLRDHPTRPDLLLAHTLHGIITGHLDEARAELLQAARTWQIGPK